MPNVKKASKKTAKKASKRQTVRRDEAIRRLGGAKVYDTIWRAKWTCDGAKTLSEAAAMLRAAADDLEAMEKDGLQLEQEIGNDYAFIVTIDPALAKKYNMQEREEDEGDGEEDNEDVNDAVTEPS